MKDFEVFVDVFVRFFKTPRNGPGDVLSGAKKLRRSLDNTWRALRH